MISRIRGGPDGCERGGRDWKSGGLGPGRARQSQRRVSTFGGRGEGILGWSRHLAVQRVRAGVHLVLGLGTFSAGVRGGLLFSPVPRGGGGLSSRTTPAVGSGSTG